VVYDQNYGLRLNFNSGNLNNSVWRRIESRILVLQKAAASVFGRSTLVAATCHALNFKIYLLQKIY
jgi:hypothetical protein